MAECHRTRRRVLRLGVAGLAGALAGCPGGNGGTETSPAETTGGEPTTTSTVRPTTTLAPTSTTAAATTTPAPTTTTTALPTTTTIPPTTTMTDTATPVPVTTTHQDDVLSESDPVPAGFGAAVAFDENTVLIGAPAADTDRPGTGRAYLYVQERGRWSQEDVLVPEEGVAGETFGSAVAVEGDLAVVGAPPAAGSGDATGSAYAFSRTFTSWSQDDVVEVDGLSSDDAFGATVEFIDRLGIVGAPGAGEVHVFDTFRDRWTHDVTLAGSDTGADAFGTALEASDDLLAVGASRASTDAADDAGAVYVYKLGDDGWARHARITLEEASAGDRFGDAVAISSNLLLAGAPGADAAGDASGTVHVFESEPSVWLHEDRIVAKDGDAGDDFGRAVALADKLAVIGAPRDENPAGEDGGSAYLFNGDVPVSNWRQEAKLLPQQGRPDAGFGADVAVVGETALVGTGGDEGVQGAGYVFDQ